MRGLESIRAAFTPDLGGSNPVAIAAREMFYPTEPGTLLSRRSVLKGGAGIGMATGVMPQLARASDNLVSIEQHGNPTQASRFAWGPGLIRNPDSGEVEIDQNRVFFGTSSNLAREDLPDAYFCNHVKFLGGSDYWLQGGEPIPQEVAEHMFPGELIKVNSQDGVNLIDSQSPVKFGEINPEKLYELHLACRGALARDGKLTDNDEYEGSPFNPGNILEQCMSDTAVCADYRINLLGNQGPASDTVDAIAAQVLPFGDQCVTWMIKEDSGWYAVYYNVDKVNMNTEEKGDYVIVKPGEEFAPKNYDGSCAAFFLMRPRVIETQRSSMPASQS